VKTSECLVKMEELMRSLVETQGRDGNWDYDQYMRGIFNGMELMLAIVEDRAPQFRDPPEDGYRVDKAVEVDGYRGLIAGEVE
jgi:hypothetical protein